MSLLARLKNQTSPVLTPVLPPVLPPAPAPAPAPASAPAPRKTRVTRPPVEEVAVEAVVVEDTKPATRALSLHDPLALLMGKASEQADSVLSFVLAEAAKPNASTNFDGAFPLLRLAKGNSGGAWQFGDNVGPETAGVLPTGRKEFTAEFLGVRIFGIAWPEAKGDTTSDQVVAPIWKAFVSSGDVELFQTVLTAGETYQFTPGAQKSKFDGLGHFRPGVEMLFYRNGEVFAMRLPDHYTSTVRALQALGAVMASVGGMRACPVVVSPYTTEEGGKVAWKCHSVRITMAASPEGAAIHKEFQQVKGQLLEDKDFASAFSEWNTTDASDDAVSALTEIASYAKR